MSDDRIVSVPGFGRMKKSQVDKHLQRYRDDLAALDKDAPGYEYKAKRLRENIDDFEAAKRKGWL